jgi:predicted PurR-regulated permease PerM
LFAVSLLFACLLEPLAERMSAWLPARNRTLAIALAFLLVIGAFSAVLIAIGAKVAVQAKQLASHPPDVRQFLNRIAQSWPVLGPAAEAAEGRIRNQLGELAAAVPKFGMGMLAASTNLIYLVVVPIVAFFMLKDGAGLRDGLLGMIPSETSRTEASRTVCEIQDLLSRYMRALLVLCSVVLLVFSAVLSALGVPYALLLASIAFLCEFVPVAGPLTALIVIVAVTALSGYPHALWVFAFLAGFRMLQDYVISPKVMGRGVEIHPLWIIFGVFAGAELAGIAGVFLSVPAMAVIRLLATKFVRKGTGTGSG